MGEVYEALALRYQQEPYRLKLSYVLKRLENTRNREHSLTALPKTGVPDNATAIYKTGAEFLAELRLIQRNLTENRS